MRVRDRPAVRRFEGKAAVVTGGASGIGDAIVRALLAEGARVAALDVNAVLLAERQRELGSMFFAIQVDVTDKGLLEEAIGECARRLGDLQLAFNVAGASRGGPILEHAAEDWTFTLDLCLSSVVLCLKHEARRMHPDRGGAIVNVSSVCAHFPVPGAAAYCAAKAGLEMLTKVAALELAERGIRVNAILPGYTHTPAVRGVAESPTGERALLERIPLRRAATPAEIAAPALFLASDEARYVTGAGLVVDGGWELSVCPNLTPSR